MDHKVVIAESAIRDLRDIVRYIALDDPVVAVRVADRLLEFAQTLRHFPERCPWFDKAAGIRKTVLPPYLLFFTVEREPHPVVNVIHFWHGAREYPDFSA